MKETLVEGTTGNINLSLGLSVYHVPSSPALPAGLLAVIAAALHFLFVPLFDEDLFVPRPRQKHDATYSNFIQLRCHFLMHASLRPCVCVCERASGRECVSVWVCGSRHSVIPSSSYIFIPLFRNAHIKAQALKATYDYFWKVFLEKKHNKMLHSP